MLQTLITLWIIGGVFWTGFYSNYIWGMWFDEYPSQSYFFKIIDSLVVTLVIFVIWMPFAFFIPIPKKFDAFDTELFLDEFGEINLKDYNESSEDRVQRVHS